MLAAAACPLMSAVILVLADDTGTDSAFLNAGSMTALLLAPLVVLRTRRLPDLLIGPTLGLLAGFLDLKTMLWLYTTAGWSLAATALVPVWGGTLGLWIGSNRPTWRSRIAVFAVVAVTDAGGRLMWMKLGAPLVIGDDMLAEWQWLIEALAYSPASVMVVLLACGIPPTAFPVQPRSLSDTGGGAD